MDLNDGGWTRPEVAVAQRALVTQQLLDPDRVGPFKAFAWAMEQIQPVEKISLLDVGCGCGHYGIWLKERYPQVVYRGTDISAEMIKQAQDLNPAAQFAVCPFEKNCFGAFGIVLVGQVMEYTPNPWVSLDKVLREAQGYLILHRIRLAEGESRRITEPTYAGHRGGNYLWNPAMVLNAIYAAGREAVSQQWEGNLTFVIKPR